VVGELRKLEEEWNSAKTGREHFDQEDHPINLNIGKIEGGDWASSVPASGPGRSCCDRRVIRHAWLMRPATFRVSGTGRIIHAGDIGKPRDAGRLRQIAPAFAVRGGISQRRRQERAERDRQREDREKTERRQREERERQRERQRQTDTESCAVYLRDPSHARPSQRHGRAPELCRHSVWAAGVGEGSYAQ
jgi:hypothetical protein